MKQRNVRYLVRGAGDVRGTVRVPGDKSISHRAVMLGSVATGSTNVTGLLEGTDVLATINAMRQMGVSISGPEDGCLCIQGVGLAGLSPPTGALDMGNSGTAMRLLTGLLVGQPFQVVLTGDRSLSSRPMQRVTSPLIRMGAKVETSRDGTPPLTIGPAGLLNGIRYKLPVASAQVKSAVLLAGMYASGQTCVKECSITRDHTERMLRGFGYPCEHTDAGVCLSGGGTLVGMDVDVPADLSSAAFFIVMATLAPDSELRLTQVGINPTRSGVLEILSQMGARVAIENEREICGEPLGDLVVRSAHLRGIEVPVGLVPLSIDEFPALCIAAACAEGTTVIRGASELRFKESDRIAVMVRGLRQIGADVEELEDGMRIHGGKISGGCVDSDGDHRIAMAFCMAGVKSQSTIEVRDCGNIMTSFPGFLQLAKETGLLIDEIR